MAEIVAEVVKLVPHDPEETWVRSDHRPLMWPVDDARGQAFSPVQTGVGEANCRNCHRFKVLDRVVDVPVVAQRQMPRIVEETHILVPHIMEKTIEVMKPVPQERVQKNNTVERFVDVPDSQIQEETVEVIQLLPQDRMPERIVEQVVDVPVSQVQERDVCSHRAVDVVMALQAEVPAVQVAQRTEDDSKIAELLKSGDEKTNLKEYVHCMKGELNDMSSITGESIGCVSSYPSMENLRTKSHEVLHVVDLADKLAENDKFDAEQKNSEEADMVINMPGAAQHRHEVMQQQVPAIQRVECAQGMVEVPKIRSSNDVMDVSEVKQRQVSTSIQTDQAVEVPRVIPHERILKPAGERTSVRERVRQLERNSSASCSNTLEAPRASPSDR